MERLKNKFQINKNTDSKYTQCIPKQYPISKKYFFISKRGAKEGQKGCKNQENLKMLICDEQSQKEPEGNLKGYSFSKNLKICGANVSQNSKKIFFISQGCQMGVKRVSKFKKIKISNRLQTSQVAHLKSL
jgi:hypothetical protein